MDEKDIDVVKKIDDENNEVENFTNGTAPRIRTHAERKKAALVYMKENGIEKGRHFFDYVTESILEYFLLDDIYELYEYSYKSLCKTANVTSGGQNITNSLINRYSYLKTILQSVREKLRALIYGRQYKMVCHAIKESSLMRKATNVDSIDALTKMIEDLTKVINREEVKAGVTFTDYHNSEKEAEDDRKNRKLVEGVMDDESARAIINEVNAALEDERKNTSLANINIDGLENEGNKNKKNHL